MNIEVRLLYKIMQAIQRGRIHVSIYTSYTNYDTPLNNSNKTIYGILKALPFKNCVKSKGCKLLLKTLSDFDCSIVNESEFQ